MLSDGEFQRFKTILRNFIVFQMSMFDEAVSKAFGEVGAVLSTALGGDPDDVRNQIESNISKDAEATVKEIRDSITEDPDAANEVRDNCPPEHLQKLVDHIDQHDVGLERIDTELSDKELAAYISLAVANHEQVGNLLEGIGQWMEQTQSIVGGDSGPGPGALGDDDFGDSEVARKRANVNALFEAAEASDSATPDQLIVGMTKLGAPHREIIDMLAMVFKAGGDSDTPVSRDTLVDAIMNFGPGQKVAVNDKQLQTLIAFDFEADWKDLSGGRAEVPVGDLKQRGFGDDEIIELDAKGDGVVDRDEMLQYWKDTLAHNHDFQIPGA
jgi:hypothetical protein